MAYTHSAHPNQNRPALAALEIGSIARGLTVVDALVKRAEVRLLRTDPITPGKMLIVFVGGEEEVLESMAKAEEIAGGDLLDQLHLPQAHDHIVPSLDGIDPPPVHGSLGTLEMATASATLLAADAALKSADVVLVSLHLAKGIGGKGYVVFTGSQDSVEAALDAGFTAVRDEHRVAQELIAHPHPDLEWALRRL